MAVGAADCRGPCAGGGYREQRGERGWCQECGSECWQGLLSRRWHRTAPPEKGNEWGVGAEVEQQRRLGSPRPRWTLRNWWPTEKG